MGKSGTKKIPIDPELIEKYLKMRGTVPQTVGDIVYCTELEPTPCEKKLLELKKHQPWTEEDDEKILENFKTYYGADKNRAQFIKDFSKQLGRTPGAVYVRYLNLKKRKNDKRNYFTEFPKP